MSQMFNVPPTAPHNRWSCSDLLSTNEKYRRRSRRLPWKMEGIKGDGMTIDVYRSAVVMSQLGRGRGSDEKVVGEGGLGPTCHVQQMS